MNSNPASFRQGDGGTYAVAGNIGLGTPDTWINLSMEYGNTDETDRSIQRDDAARLIRVGNTDVNDPAQPWGQPFVRDDLKVFANYGATISTTISNSTGMVTMRAKKSRADSISEIPIHAVPYIRDPY